MSKNVVIQEGGAPKTLNGVSKLRTALSGGGTQLWIPEEEAHPEADLGNKNITENGTYYARDDDLDGYDTINVNVKGVTGTDPDDGEEHYVEVDDGGELEDTKLPVRIEITKEPDKLEYEDGETINPTGIIVHAYYKNGDDYGTVLNSELQFDPTTAAYSGGEGSASSDLIDGDVIFGGPPGNDYVDDSHISNWFDGGDAIAFVRSSVGSSNVNIIYAAKQPFVGSSYNYVGGRKFNYNESYVDKAYTVEGKTVYYSWGSTNINADNATPPANEPMPNVPAQYIAWTIIHGERSGAGSQTITVNWPRIKDRKILSDTFDITVTAGEGGGKATPTLTLSPSSLSLSAASPIGEVTVTTNSDGAVTVSSSDANIATAAISGNTVHVNAGTTAGTATITVSVAETETYEAVSATITVVVTGRVWSSVLATVSKDDDVTLDIGGTQVRIRYKNYQSEMASNNYTVWVDGVLFNQCYGEGRPEVYVWYSSDSPDSKYYITTSTYSDHSKLVYDVKTINSPFPNAGS